MEAKHTPGPWGATSLATTVAVYGGTPESNRPRVAKCDNELIDKDEAKANARLIAAAPELLEAIQLLLSVYVEVVHPTDPFGEAANAEHKARAAIAKAKGE